METIELGFMLDCAELVIAGATARREVAAADHREDFPERDDVNWLKHTLAYLEPEGVRMSSVTITWFQPSKVASTEWLPIRSRSSASSRERQTAALPGIPG